MKTDKTKDRLYEMFERVCGVKLINESEENNIDFGILVKGYVNGVMEIISGLVDMDNKTKEASSEDDGGEYASADDENDYLMGNGDGFAKDIALDNARVLVDDFNRVGLDSFVSEYVDEDSLISTYNDIKKIINGLGDDIIKRIVSEKINLLKLGGLILFLRNGDMGEGSSMILTLKIKDSIKDNNIKGIDFSVSRGKLIFFDNGKGNLV